MKTIQQFQERAIQAYTLHGQSKESFFNPGDIVHCYLGCNIGNETDGKEKFIRPVLIVRRVGNVFRCLALTSQGKDSIYQKKIDEKSFVILSSLMTLDKKRFIRTKYKIPKILLHEIKKAIAELSLG